MSNSVIALKAPFGWDCTAETSLPRTCHRELCEVRKIWELCVTPAFRNNYWRIFLRLWLQGFSCIPWNHHISLAKAPRGRLRARSTPWTQGMFGWVMGFGADSQEAEVSWASGDCKRQVSTCREWAGEQLNDDNSSSPTRVCHKDH